MPKVLLEGLLCTLVILRDPIRVDMCEIFLVCLVAAALPTLACILVGPLFGLSFDEEASVIVQISNLRDRSQSLVKVVFDIQVSKNKMMV
jgi:hypothetical protein